MGLLTAYAFTQRERGQEQAARARRCEAKAESEAGAAKAARAASLKSEQKAQDKSKAAAASAQTAKNAQAAEAAQAKEARRQTRIAQAERDEQRRLRTVADDARADAERQAVSEARAKDAAVASENKAIMAKNDALEQARKRQISEQRAVAEKNRAEASALVAEAISLLDIDPERSLQLALLSAIDGLHARAGGHAAQRLDEGPRPRGAAERERAGHCDRDELERIVCVCRPVEREQRGRAASSSDGTLVLVGGADGEARVFDLATGRRLARLRPGAAAQGRGVLAGREVRHHG